MDDKKAIENLLLDIDILNELNQWTNDVNIFEVAGMVSQEIKHSNTLAWFFDPNESHSLGDEFIKRFLQKVISKNEHTNSNMSIFDISLMDYSTFIVKREWKHIDILLISNELKTVIAIENKVYARESDGQLNKYYETLQSEFSDYKKTHIFLTLDGSDPSDINNWYIADYDMIIDSLNELLTSKTSISNKTKIIINDYINIIRRNFGMDKELTQIAQKIYSKHKKAFDLMFQVTSNNVIQFSEYIKNWLETHKEILDINYNQQFSGATQIRFTTPFIDEMFPFDADKNDGWGFGHAFMYEFVVRKDSIHVIGYLSDFNRENSELFLNYKKRGHATRWKRVMSKKVILREDDISEGLNEETINKLEIGLKNIMTTHILKFEKEINGLLSEKQKFFV